MLNQIALSLVLTCAAASGRAQTLSLHQGDDSRQTSATDIRGMMRRDSSVVPFRRLAAPFSAATAARPLAAHFPDVVNVGDYGAACDGAVDDSAAFDASIAAATGKPSAVIVVPSGTCRLASPLLIHLSKSNSLVLEGSGSATTRLLFDAPAMSGVTVVLSDKAASFSVRHIGIRRNSTSRQAGVGLQITATVAAAVNTTSLEDIHVDGVARAGSWSTGLVLTNLSTPVIHGLAVILPDGGGNVSAGADMRITGTNGLFAIDAKVSDSLLQGGHIGLSVSGSVQGIYWVNTHAIGNDNGIDWADIPGNKDFPELLNVTNSHFNNWNVGIHLARVNQINVSSNLFLHFGSASGYRAIQVEDNQEVAITGNLFNGSGSSNEIPIRLVNSQLNAITGNSMVFFGGPCIDVGTNVQTTAVTGNSCNGVDAIAIIQDSRHLDNAIASNLLNGKSVTKYENIVVPTGASAIFADTSGANDAYVGDDPATGFLAVGNFKSAAQAGLTTRSARFSGDLSVGGALLETSSRAPTSSTSPCTVGQHAWDRDYEYRCISVNSWKRASLSSW